ncbi:MAG: peptidoglycan DD-metalloendopeptidase family protein [Rhodovibrionaceae bacterium]|nr:peptidoglycan DD-metalloendopeptidase family protein [Rhodovibrionaceae bacterium]
MTTHSHLPARAVAIAVLTVLLAPAAAGLLVAPAAAQQQQGAPNDLESIEERIEKDRAEAERLAKEAQALRSEISRLRQESIAAAAKAQDLEEQISENEAQLARLQQEEAEKRAALAERRSQLADTLAALQRIAIRPPEATLIQPGEPLDVVRSAMLLRVAVPAIERRAEKLNSELETLRDLRGRIDRSREQLGAAAEALASERARLSTLLTEKERLTRQSLDRSAAARERVQALVEEAENLRELMDAIEREAAARRERERLDARGRRLFQQTREQMAALTVPQPEPPEARDEPPAPEDTGIPAIPEPPGGQTDAGADQSPGDRLREQLQKQQQTAALPGVPLDKPANIRSLPAQARPVLLPPVRGRIEKLFGQPDPKTGVTSKGITLTARDGAQVVAPFDGQVAYAGQFRGYGSILILEHAGGYHTLLAGLTQINAVTGQWVLAGEPIGRLNKIDGDGPRLYVELRRESQPINPLPWLATTGDKVRG